MKGLLKVGVIGTAVSLAAILSPAEGIQAWGPFAVLSTGVGLLTVWVVASDHTPARRAGTTVQKRAA
jgi:hypothetical protein